MSSTLSAAQPRIAARATDDDSSVGTSLPEVPVGEDEFVELDEEGNHERMDLVQRELEPFLDTTPVGSDEFTGMNTRRTGSLLAEPA